MLDKEVYNDKLINRLNRAKKQAGVSYDIMAHMMGLPYDTAYAYLTKRRNMVRSDDERTAIAVIKILERLVKEKHLPKPRKIGRPRKGLEGKRNEEILALIDDCAKRLLKEADQESQEQK